MKSEAEKSFMAVSDYIRGIIFDNRNYSSKALGKGSRESLQATPEILTKVNQELIRMEHNLERLRGAKKVNILCNLFVMLLVWNKPIKLMEEAVCIR